MALSKEQAAALRDQIKRAKTLEYLSCRVGGDRHRWVRCIPDFEPAYKNATAVVHQCDACTTIKRAVITKQGELLGKADYEYPDGYTYRKQEDEEIVGGTLFSSQAVRAAMLDRVNLTDLPPLHDVYRRPPVDEPAEGEA